MQADLCLACKQGDHEHCEGGKAPPINPSYNPDDHDDDAAPKYLDGGGFCCSCEICAQAKPS